MLYRFPQKVLFIHCDPAGIAFYPRLFEMINDAVEAMFADVLKWPFETMHPDYGVPTARFDIRFQRPCRHGDVLDLQLRPLALGATSLRLETRAHCDGSDRFIADQTIVCVGTGGKPTQWPASVRATLSRTMKEKQN